MVDMTFLSRHRALARPGTTQWHDEAAQARTMGVPVLSLSGAVMGSAPRSVLEAGREAFNEPMRSPRKGLEALRKCVSKKLAVENNIHADPEGNLLITYGARQAIDLVLRTVLQPGDEVLLFSPSYPYEGNIRLAGGIPTYVAAHEETGFSLPLLGLSKAMTRKSRVLILNTPLNPTGHVATLSELSALASLAQEADLFVLADESFEKLVYEPNTHISIASLPGMASRTATVFSFTKIYGLGNWRVGYLAAPAWLIEDASTMMEWTVIHHNPVAQILAHSALAEPPDWMLAVRRQFTQNRDALCKAIMDVPKLSFVRPEGTGSVFLNIQGFCEDDVPFARRLLWEHGLPVVPGAIFESPGYVRLPFGGTLQDVLEAAERLRRALDFA